MRAAKRIWHYLVAVSRARRNRTDLSKWLIRRPQVAIGMMVYETMLILSNRLDPKLKELAELKTAGLVHCEFCLDIGSSLAHSSGVSARKIAELAHFRTSDAYDELEKLALELAEAMTVTPASADLDDLRARLLTHISKGQFAELASAISWENQRARLNLALGVRPTGMADGGVCALPERPARPAA